MTGNIKKLPVIIIAQVVGGDDKAQCAGTETSEFVPVRVFISINNTYVGAFGWYGAASTLRHYRLDKNGSPTNRKLATCYLPGIGARCLAICSSTKKNR